MTFTHKASVDGFVHRLAGHCGSGAFRDLLEHWGLSYDGKPATESMAFGLGGTLGFTFMLNPQMDPPLYMVGRTGGLERQICDRINVALDFRQTDQNSEAWKWITDDISNGHPVMIWADIKKLDYLNVRLSNTHHDVLIVGFDEEAGHAMLADNDREEIQHCSLESLSQARNSNGFPVPNRNGTWLMRAPTALPRPEVTIRGAIAQSIENMRSGGLDSIHRFGESYSQWPDLLAEKLDDEMGLLRVFIEKAGTGGGIFRRLQANFLLESAELLNDSRIEHAGKVHSELADRWAELAYLVKDSEDRREAHREGLSLVEEVIRLEEAAISSAEEAIS